MSSMRPEEEKYCVIGTGEIGNSWIALFLAHERSVIAWDPVDGWQDRLNAYLGGTTPALKRLGLAAAGQRRTLILADSMPDAVRDATFIQECVPEDLELKQKLFTDIEPHLKPEALLVSSTSSYIPSDMAAGLRNPARLLVGHPFNPPHLLPAVEVVGSSATPKEAIERAAALYRSVGRDAIVMDREVPGFIGNRLQFALTREAFAMVAAGEATFEQLDRIILGGPGPRWPFDEHCVGNIDWIANPDGSINDTRYEVLIQSEASRLQGPALTDEFRSLLEAELAAYRARTDKLTGADYEATLVSVLEATGRGPKSQS